MPKSIPVNNKSITQCLEVVDVLSVLTHQYEYTTLTQKQYYTLQPLLLYETFTTMYVVNMSIMVNALPWSTSVWQCSNPASECVSV